jgi:hypothetical protein
MSSDHDDETLYNVASYSDKELLEILDVTPHASDRELEATIVQMMNLHPEQRAFFEGIYRRFFDLASSSDEDEDKEGFETMVLQDKNVKVSKEVLDEDVKQGEAALTSSMNLGALLGAPPDNRQTQSTVLTKAVDYIKDPKSLNPTFNNTIQRVLIVDSRCRDRTVYPSSTDFTLNLTEILKNVLALNFYYVNVPYTWYTISKAYGANFFYLNGNAPGINDVNHAIQVSVLPGNYTTPQSLVEAVNAGIQNLAQTRPDISFGSSGVVVNSTMSGDGKATFTWDIQNRFGDSSYELKWSYWTSPISGLATASVPGFLGFLRNPTYALSSVLSNFGHAYVAGDLDMVDEIFQVDASNNYFTILNKSAEGAVLNTIVIEILPLGAYNRNDLVQKVCVAMQGSPFLNAQYSGIFFQQDNFDSDYVMRFRLTVQMNRFTTSNQVGQTQVIVFPDESARVDPAVWTGASSAFFFDAGAAANVNSTVAELGSGLGDVYDQTGYSSSAFYTYTVPDVQLVFTCKKFPEGVADAFNRVNSFSIQIPKGSDYTLHSYQATINDSFRAQLPNNFKIDDGAPKLFQYDYYARGRAYMNVGFQFAMTYKNFTVNATNSVLSTVFGLPAIMDFRDGSSVYVGTPFALSSSSYLVNNDNRRVVIRTVSGDSAFTFHLPYAPTEDRPKHKNPNNGSWYTYSDLSGIEAAFNGGKYGFNNVQSKTASYQVNNGGGTYVQGGATSVVQDALYGLNLTGTRIAFTVAGQQATCTLSWNISNLVTEQDYTLSLDGDSWGSDFGFTEVDYTLNDSRWSPTGSAFATVYADKDVLTTSMKIYTTTSSDGQIQQNNQLVVQPRANADSLSEAIIVTIPPGLYNRFELVRAWNAAFAKSAVLQGTRFVWCGDDLENVRIDWKVNKVYRAQDYTLTFFDIYEFGHCENSGSTGNTSLRSIRWEQTLGWLLGFRSLTAYNLLETEARSSNKDVEYASKNPYKLVLPSLAVQLTGDTPVNVNIYNQLHVVLDDYTSNHMNDGVVTVAPPTPNTSIQSYASKAAKRCNPTTNQAMPSFQSTDPTMTDSTGRLAPLLSENQMYAALVTGQSRQDIQNKVAKTQSPATNVKDMFALVPLKLSGMQVGQAYTEFGGTLQQNNRKYFGPVNIQRLGIKLLSDRGDVVDLNNNDWSVGIICDISIQY